MSISRFNCYDVAQFRHSRLKAAVLFSFVYGMCAFQQASALEVVSENSLVAGSYPITSGGQLTITISGADGGDATAGSQTAGGSGASATGIFDVVAGQVVYYVVGEAGVDGGSGGGGGSTGVYIDNTLVLVAGAGGGGDNSGGQVGLGGNATTSGDAGTGTDPGAGGTGGTGGGLGGGNDSGGGGGISSAGGDGQPGNGGGQADGTVPLSISLGGDADYPGTAGDGGAGFSGGGGADPTHFSGGGGGYSGGGGAGSNGAAGGGGSFANTSASGYVSSSITAGDDGAGANTSGTLVLDFCSITNVATVSGTEFDPVSGNNTSTICTEVLMSDFDFSDAPASYGSAGHVVTATPTVYLGNVVPDVEASASFSGNADGDDTNQVINDEEGVIFRSPAGTNKSIFADVEVMTDQAINVCGWLDRDGSISSTSFSSGDAPDFYDATGSGVYLPFTDCINVSTSGTVSFQWRDLPTDKEYITFARFRVTSDALDSGDWTGVFSDGEVEDFQISFNFTGDPTAVTIGSVDLKATRATDFLADLGIEQLDAPALLKLLDTWDPIAAANLVESDREAILYELRDFLDPDGDGQVAVLAWDTLEERGTIGFYVERQQGDSGWLRINDDMLPGLITAPMGGEYQLADPGASPGQTYQYRLIEQEARGSTRTYGPFTVEMQ